MQVEINESTDSISSGLAEGSSYSTNLDWDWKVHGIKRAGSVQHIDSVAGARTNFGGAVRDRMAGVPGSPSVHASAKTFGPTA